MRIILKIIRKQILHGDQFKWIFHCFLLHSFDYFEELVNLYRTTWHMGRDNSVAIATRYRLDGPGIESQRRGPRFSAPVPTGPGAHAASNTMGTWSFPGVKRPGRGDEHQPPSTAEVKERVELNLYSHSGSSWFVLV